MTRSEMKAVYIDAYTSDANTLLATTSNLDFWSASGPYRGEDDLPRRWRLGQEMCDRYICYYEAHPDETPWTTPDGDLAVELEVRLDCDGVEVLTFIDGVYFHPSHDLIVRDDKTGSTVPDSTQLKVYSMAVNRRFTTDIRYGDYWMGRTGRPGRIRDLTTISDQEIIDAFAQLDADVTAERFDPTPSPEVCRMCSVNTACVYAQI